MKHWKRGHQRLALLVVPLAICGDACARSDAATVPASLSRVESIPPGQSPPIALPASSPGTAGGPFVIAATGTLTRRSATETVARVNLTVTNTSAAPQRLSATQFSTNPPLIATATAAQIRDATLLPGQSVTGAMAWRAEPGAAVRTLTVQWSPPGSAALWSRPVTLHDAEPEHTAVGPERVGLLEVLRTGIRAVRYTTSFASSVTFRGYRGTEWLVRVLATVTNTGRVSVPVSRSHFQAREAGVPLTDLLSTVPVGLAQPYYYRQNYTYCTGGRALRPNTVLEPGQSVTAALCWATAPGGPQPASPEITVRIPGVAASARIVATVSGSP